MTSRTWLANILQAADERHFLRALPFAARRPAGARKSGILLGTQHLGPGATLKRVALVHVLGYYLPPLPGLLHRTSMPFDTLSEPYWL